MSEWWNPGRKERGWVTERDVLRTGTFMCDSCRRPSGYTTAKATRVRWFMGIRIRGVDLGEVTQCDICQKVIDDPSWLDDLERRRDHRDGSS